MRPTFPRKLWLLGICALPGATVLASGLFRPPADEPHRHEWAPYRPPGGTLSLVDARRRPVTHLEPGQTARLICLPAMNVDRCRRPDPECVFAPEGTAVEDGGPRLLDFRDGGAGGEFGILSGGRFQAVPPDESWRATHYRAGGKRWGTFAFTARFDDTAHVPARGGKLTPSYDDPPAESAAVWVGIGPRL